MFAIGSILDRTPGRKYTEKLRFAELALRAPLPRPATLSRWRTDLPEGFALALRAPRSALTSKRGPLRLDASNEAMLAWALEAASALEVRALVLPTPADLAPGTRSRELLSAFRERLPRVPGRHYVWAPSGVWESEDSERLCAELELVRAFDPLEKTRPAGEVVYAELRALGHRSGFSTAALEDALSRITSEPTREAYVVVDATRGFDIATKLSRLAAERGLSAPFSTDEAPASDFDARDGDGEDEDAESDEDPDDEDGT